jgi:GTP-binding protein Era
VANSAHSFYSNKKMQNMENPAEHKAGFVNIVGKPNVGKSTLMNALVGERLSIITAKAQTTRHRILGIVNGDNFQIVYSDTPGVLKPSYKMQESMMRFVHDAFDDADVLLVMTDASDKADRDLNLIADKINRSSAVVIFLLNKCDTVTPADAEEQLNYWRGQIKAHTYLAVSALKGDNLGLLFDTIVQCLPFSPPYYPDKDDLTDRPERFFISEIIREKILLIYHQEIPYSVEVVIDSFKDSEEIVRIDAIIWVNRESQKPILIGKHGSRLNELGIMARQDIEKFVEKKVYLGLRVKVREGWRDNELLLKNLGYQ